MSTTIRLPQKRSKYGNRKTEYRGALYDSAAEARYAAQLDLLMKAGRVSSWDRQVLCPLQVNGVLICKMVMDFMVWYAGDEAAYPIDVKGVVTRDWALKRKLFEAIHGLKITVINAKDVR